MMTELIITKHVKDRRERFEPLTRLSGTPIQDSHGELVGWVTDLIIDLSDARLAFLRITLLPFNGGDERYCVTVPWSIATLDGQDADRTMRVAVRRKTLMRVANAGREQ